ncbi:MAG TPA: sigma-70 family RNA polymerase sigma factor [Kribbellaceae bacterium]|nr:sigma-70 family RNA polymerase sigma factor [Kribbellaceae bacterium]
MARERPRILGGLIRSTGDWELAEDCLQDATERALSRWPRDGTPDNPAAWLTTTAQRRALDVLRRRQTEAEKVRQVAAELEPETAGTDPHGDFYRDDQLRLIFTCCHPALPLDGQVALTLKTVAGLSARQIAQAFLVSEATMSQRLLRTRRKLAHAAIPFRVPEPHRIAERTAGVLAVIYLVFNEGYTSAAAGVDLAGEAVRLATLVARLLPDDDEAQSLEALLLFQHSRHAARTDAGGELVAMEDQDRGLWDRAMIDRGLAALAGAGRSGRAPGPYQLQARIAAVHASASGPGTTDWARIVASYDDLLALHPSPVVALNRAVALAFRDGPGAGLAALDVVASDALGGYPPLPAVRADLLRRAGRLTEAATAYREAIGLARSELDRQALERRLRECEPG